MAKSQNLLQQSLILSARLIREQAAPLATLLVISIGLTIFLQDGLVAMGQTDASERWVFQISLALWDLLEAAALVLVLCWGIPKVRGLTEAHFLQHPFAESYVGSFAAEYLRVLANVILWGLLLLIPGFLRYCRLIFVPFVALFARPYREGKVDALKLAAALTRGRYAAILGLVFTTSLLQAALEFLPMMRPEFHVWTMRVSFSVISYLLSIWLCAILYLMFERAMEEYEWS